MTTFLVTTNRLDSTGFSSGCVVDHFKDKTVMEMVAKISEVSGFSLENARKRNYVSEVWSSLKPSWFSSSTCSSPAQGLNNMLKNHALKGLTVDPSQIELKYFLDALDCLKELLPGRQFCSDFDEYLSRGAGKISPASLKFLFFVTREAFIFQSLDDVSFLRKVLPMHAQPEDVLQEVDNFARVHDRFFRKSFPYGFAVDTSVPVFVLHKKATVVRASREVTKQKPTEVSDDDEDDDEDKSKTLAVVSLSTDQFKQAALQAVIGQHSAHTQSLDGASILGGMSSIMASVVDRKDFVRLYDSTKRFLYAFRHAVANDPVSDNEVASALSRFRDAEDEDPLSMRNNPGAFVGFLEDFFPSLKTDVKRLLKLMKKHKERRVTDRSYGDSVYTGNDEVDMAVDISVGNTSEIRNLRSEIESLKRAAHNNYGGGGGGGGGFSGGGGGGNDKGVKKPKKNVARALSTAIDLLRKRCPQMINVPKKALALAGGKCFTCGVAFDRQRPCCVGKTNVSPDIIAMIRAIPVNATE
jgi:uncharacterized membrane protein YgcG